MPFDLSVSSRSRGDRPIILHFQICLQFFPRFFFSSTYTCIGGWVYNRDRYIILNIDVIMFVYVRGYVFPEVDILNFISLADKNVPLTEFFLSR